MRKIAIIGAGIAGLTAAHQLKQHAEITIFEKSRGVSGRASTRYANPYYFDHGAQYFTVRTTAFENFIQPLLQSGKIQRWNAHYVRFDGTHIIEHKDWRDEAPRYVAVPGMNALAQHFAEGLTIHLNTHIESLQKKDQWQLQDQNHTCYDGFDWVISTLPAPQAAVLLPVDFEHHAYVQSVQMRACFSLMLGFEEALPIEFQAAYVDHSDLSWIALNSSKPGRSAVPTLMVHSSEDYAEKHYNDDRTSSLNHLCQITRNTIGYDVSRAHFKGIHGWRHANNAQWEHSPILIDTRLKLAACGDWCLGGRVESAFTSAHDLAAKIVDS